MMSATEGDDRPTMPAICSPAEAEHWLLCESIGSDADLAREVRKARALGRPCSLDAVAWLRSVAAGAGYKANWAQLVLSDLEKRKLIPAPPRAQIIDLFEALKQSLTRGGR